MKFIISEHTYMYGFTHQRLCCMFVLGYTVLFCNSIGYCVNNISKIRGYIFGYLRSKVKLKKYNILVYSNVLI